MVFWFLSHRVDRWNPHSTEVCFRKKCFMTGSFRGFRDRKRQSSCNKSRSLEVGPTAGHCLPWLVRHWVDHGWAGKSNSHSRCPHACYFQCPHVWFWGERSSFGGIDKETPELFSLPLRHPCVWPGQDQSLSSLTASRISGLREGWSCP